MLRALCLSAPLVLASLTVTLPAAAQAQTSLTGEQCTQQRDERPRRVRRHGGRRGRRRRSGRSAGRSSTSGGPIPSCAAAGCFGSA